ncbi:MAG TPA: hypothetical protein ENI73_07250 [Spirochaetes bacterium]|nr:hypothetical protein [Spirochaetota bacterium]
MTDKCLTNKDLHNYVMEGEKDNQTKSHLEDCSKCMKQYTIIRQLLHKMAEYPCFRSIEREEGLRYDGEIGEEKV